MRFVSAAVLVLAVACGASDAGTAPTSSSVVGTWTLQSVNGSALPFVVSQTGANKLELVSDVVSATASGTFTQSTTIRNTTNGQVTTQSVPDAGSYSLNGTAVTFQFNSDNSVGTGSLNGNTMTVAQDGFAYIYKRQ
jgi:hypothetical protein